MQPISPVVPGLEEHEIKIAESQDEYGTLPALIIDNGQRVISRWQLTWRERLTALFNGNIYLHVWTFGGPLQPVHIDVDEPRLLMENRLEEVPNA